MLNFKLIGNIFLILFVIFTKNTYSQVNLSPEGSSVKNNILKKHSNQYICDNAVAQITDNWEWRKTSLFKPFVDEAFRRGLSCGIQSNKQIEIKNIKSNNKNNIKKHTNLKSVNSQVNKNISSNNSYVIEYRCTNQPELNQCKTLYKDTKYCKNPEENDKMSGFFDVTYKTVETTKDRYNNSENLFMDLYYGKIKSTHEDFVLKNPSYYPFKGQLIIHSFNGERKDQVLNGSVLNYYEYDDNKVKTYFTSKFIFQKDDIQLNFEIKDGFSHILSKYVLDPTFRMKKRGTPTRDNIFYLYNLDCAIKGKIVTPKKQSNIKDVDKLFK